MMSGPASAAGGAAVIGEVVEAGGANVMLGKPDAVELTSGEARTLCEGAMSFLPQTPQAGEPVIIDTDPGIDDALALVFAAASSMRIEGVTIVHGNGKDVRQLGTVDVRARLRERERTVRMIPTTIKARGGGRNHRGLARGDGLNHRGLAFVDFDLRHALEH